MTLETRPEPTLDRDPEPRDSDVGPRRAWLRALGLVVVLALAWDLSREPPRQASARVLLTGIDLYQATLSPRLPAAGVSCRFQPSCSRYAESVIRRDGALPGGLRTVGRIARCGPWTPEGTEDPP